ncbi:glycosyltransferase [Propionivibrio dicarboxylicus]|uniref:Spore maturation protein CgeB n=1 Tax=Propionivibrio dicarboxylicus TaxID=83767 RepID=A0A1G8L0P7_9RHOO|nr:glycosyltransferase [Propionivibrio dicarboxylicus]SDI49249.1 spore maturation protein CgeB [Propionivibrio dicarboxylicus]
MSPVTKNILIHEDAKPLIPLRAGLSALGIQLLPAAEMAQLSDTRQVLGYFACFYRSLSRPAAAWLRHRQLARAGIPIVTWNRDAPHYLNYPAWRLTLASKLRLTDIYATHTLIDADKYGFAPTTLYLANAVEPATYSPPEPVSGLFPRLRDESTYAVDVSFFGGMNGQAYKEDADRAEFFSALSKRLTEEKISHVFRETGDMTPSQQIAFILSSKINLNYGARCEYKARIASGLPERCFGIPGVGGFLLCDKRTHSRDDFDIGKNWAEYDGIDDCVTKIKYWLAHFQSARDIAEQCQQHVMRQHTYQHRAARLVNALIAWHDSRPALNVNT